MLASPSVDDFGPMMVNEAFMCATPIVAFNIGVARDLIKSEKTGYLAKKYDADDFASGLAQYLLGNSERGHDAAVQKLREACRPDFQATQYILLFQDLLSKQGA